MTSGPGPVGVASFYFMQTTRDTAGYVAVQEYLFGLKARGVKFGIHPMRVLF